jgi:membrane protease subunit (stomatin/prohibitin family)
VVVRSDAIVSQAECNRVVKWSAISQESMMASSVMFDGHVMVIDDGVIVVILEAQRAMVSELVLAWR